MSGIRHPRTPELSQVWFVSLSRGFKTAHLEPPNTGSKPGGELAREAGRRHLLTEYRAGPYLPALGTIRGCLRLFWQFVGNQLGGWSGELPVVKVPLWGDLEFLGIGRKVLSTMSTHFHSSGGVA